MKTTKKCSSCKSVLPLSAFHRNGLSPDGRHCRCRTCRGVSYRKGNTKSILSLDEAHLNETLESILDEIRSDVQAIKRAKENGWLGGDPDIKVICKARTETFKSVLDNLFKEYKLTKKILDNGTIQRVNGEIRIRLRKVNNA